MRQFTSFLCREKTMHPVLKKFSKEILFYSPLRRFFLPRYDYLFNPSELCFLCQCIEETRHVEGAITEIGCSKGATTVFLNKYMDSQNIQKDYYAVDTFSGFVAEDIGFEVTNRGKSRDIFNILQDNKKKWFDRTMQDNRITRVRSIEADVNEYDLTTLGPLSFSLLDVNLYRPTKKALHELYEVLSPHGIIIVDDVGTSPIHSDGADEAYREFIQERDLRPEIYHSKLGVISKPFQQDSAL